MRTAGGGRALGVRAIRLSVGETSQAVAEKLGHESRSHRRGAAAAADASLADARHRLAHRLSSVLHL